MLEADPAAFAPAVERGQKSGERIARGARQPLAGDQVARGLDQRQRAGARFGVQQLQGRGADAAARHVDDALEGEVVGRLAHQAQIGERVADLLPLVKPRPADHAIGQRERNEPVFELARLEPGAHQDRDFAERLPLTLQRLDLVADPAGLLLGVPQPAHHNFVAGLGAGPQGLAEPPAIMGDDAGRGGEDLRRRAVILLEAGNQRAGKIALETQDVADLGAAPTVDRLVVVADAADVAMLLRQQPQPQVLRDVGVLILVDQQVAKPPLVRRKDLRDFR